MSLGLVSLGVLAVGEKPLPSYLWNAGVRPLGVAAIVLLLAALLCALFVLLPRRIALSSHRPDQQQAAFERLLARKAWGLRAAAVAFVLGLLLLGAILIVALLTAV